MLEEKMTITAQDQKPLHLNIFLPAESPPDRVILTVHGFGEYGMRYRNWARHFTDRNCIVFAHDQRGHGLTEGPRGVIGSYRQFLEDIDAVLEKIRSDYPELPVILYGHSMGGNISLNYLMKNQDAPINLAIISSPWLRLKKDTPLVLVRLIEKIMGPEFVLKTKLNTLSSDRADLKEISIAGLYHKFISATMAKGVMEAGLFALGNPDLLTVPTLLMSGGKDMIVDLKSIEQLAASGNPLVRYLPWPDLHHELHNETRREEVFAAVWDFITEHS